MKNSKIKNMVMVIAIITIPISTSAISIEDLQMHIRQLMSKVSELQKQILQQKNNSSITSPTSPVSPISTIPTVSKNTTKQKRNSTCINTKLTHSLWVGRRDISTNGEVSKLQNFLTETGDYTYGEVTGYYGLITMNAVRQWQRKNNILAIGIVGPKTRTKMAVCLNKTHTKLATDWGNGKIDNWQFNQQTDKTGRARGGNSFSRKMKTINSRAMVVQHSAPMADMTKMSTGLSSQQLNIGFSVGGAKDINNFRENIKNNFTPTVSDITHEGLFYDYYFNTGEGEQCNKLFCPSFSTAVSPDPFSKQKEYFLSVGLNSGIKSNDFKRKKLNLVVVLDISGSMNSTFNKYYYDKRNTSNHNIDDEENYTKTKMQVATESVSALLNHLNGDDNFGMVLFDNSAYAAKPISSVAETDMEAIKKHVLEIYPQGGTNMSSGMLEATKMLEAFKNKTGSDYESRIIFLTDAMPNKGMLNRKDIASIASTNADHKIFSTFIGIGVDFNSGLVDSITKIRGANYYSVHSSKEFKKRMDDEFEYMVTPLVFNLQLKLDAPGYKLLKVYGSPEADLATGEIMKVNTLFPSSQVDGEVKGGLVLLHLRKVSDDTSITLSTSYEDRDGANGNSVKSVSFKNNNIEYYDNSGIRKGILLSRYTNLLKHWIIDERAKKMPEPPKYHGYETLLTRCGTVGIPVMHPPVALGRWERTSMPLTVSGDYSALFRDFNTYFKSEAAKTGDESMVEKESTVLNTLGDK